MTFSITYKPLFEIKILHKYFLNKGTEDFFSMDELTKEKQLADFDVSTLFSIVPTLETQRKLKGQNLVFKTSNHGLTVWARLSEGSEVAPLIPVDDSLELTFLLKLLNHTFYNFTNLDMLNVGKLLFFSNKRLSTETPSFPLIKIDDNQIVDDNYVLSNESQNAELEMLTVSEKENLAGIIRICMKGETTSLDVITAEQEISEPYRVFQILFDNRKTVWRYFFSSDQSVKNKDDVQEENGNAKQLITKTPQPLTKKGFVSLELDGAELPNPNANLIKPNGDDNEIYSEIYI